MKTTIKLDIAPFDIPDVVFEDQPMKYFCGTTTGRNKIVLLLSELSDETLGMLCDDFRIAVFKKARMNPPAPLS